MLEHKDKLNTLSNATFIQQDKMDILKTQVIQLQQTITERRKGHKIDSSQQTEPGKSTFIYDPHTSIQATQALSPPLSLCVCHFHRKQAHKNRDLHVCYTSFSCYFYCSKYHINKDHI